MRRTIGRRVMRLIAGIDERIWRSSGALIGNDGIIGGFINEE